MKKKLERLDQLLQKIRPEYYSSLQPALSPQQISELGAKYDLTLPTELATLYQWKDGQRTGIFDSFVNNSMFIPLGEALAIQAELTGMIGFDFEIVNWWNKNWIPIFHNGGGDYICYDLEGTFTGNPGQLIEFWHADSDRNVIAPNLGTFIDQLIQLYDTTDANDLDEFIQLAAVTDYPKCYYVE